VSFLRTMSWRFGLLILTFSTLLRAAVENELPDDSDSPGKLFAVEGKIKLRVILPNGTSSGAQLTTQQRKMVHDDMKVSLSGNHVHYSTLVRQDGKFVFGGVLPGAYFLDVSSRYYGFEPLRVDVSKIQQGKVKAKKLLFPKPVDPIVLSPVSQITFFEPERQLDITSYIFGNKMIWIIGAMTLMMFFMSKVSPEVIQQQQQQQQTTEDNSSPERLLSTIIPETKKKKNSQSS